jgi:hypothetical protein
MTPAGRRPALMAWASIAVRAELKKKETPPNREASAAPAGKPHVALGHDRRKINEAEFVRG